MVEERRPCVGEAAGGRRSRRNSNWSSGCTQIDPGGWSDVSACFIRTVNHILDRSDFRRVNQMA